MENEKEEASDYNIILICLCLSIAIFTMDLLIPLGVAAGVPYIIVVLISLRSPNKKLPIIVAISVSILTITGFYLSPSGGELWKVLLNRAVALLAVWSTAILIVQRAAFHLEQNKAQEELKILTGLLPICASCKKIRDEKGSWNQMESYIRDHSEAEFSHGVCPDCSTALYGDFLGKNETN